MSEKELEHVEDDFATGTDEDSDSRVEPAKTNLSKRRTIDNILEERRLKRQLADYDFDL